RDCHPAQNARRERPDPRSAAPAPVAPSAYVPANGGPRPPGLPAGRARRSGRRTRAPAASPRAPPRAGPALPPGDQASRASARKRVPGRGLTRATRISQKHDRPERREMRGDEATDLQKPAGSSALSRPAAIRAWLARVRFADWAHFLVLPLATIDAHASRSDTLLAGARGVGIAFTILAFGFLINSVADREMDIDVRKNSLVI